MIQETKPFCFMCKYRTGGGWAYYRCKNPLVAKPILYIQNETGDCIFENDENDENDYLRQTGDYSHG